VRAELNDPGDGFVLIDDAGGGGTLKVEDIDGNTAADLRLLGDSVVGGDGKQRVSSRFAVVVEVVSGDTLDDLVKKINQSAGFLTASVFNDGSAFSSMRLKLTATVSGSAGQFSFDDGGLGLNLSTMVSGKDALLRIGGDTQSGFLIASETNAFTDVFTGMDVDLKQVGTTSADVVVSRDDSKIEKALQSFVDGFNSFVAAAADLTKFNSTTGARGILQGQGIVLRVRSRLNSLVSRRFSGFKEIDSLFDLGIRSRADGKLEFNKDRLTDALAENRQAVADFFLTKETGFGEFAQTVVETLTDPISGSFALEGNALQDSIKSLTDRITQLDGLLAARRERLLRQFANMESVLSLLTSQQSALFAMQPLSIIPARRGVS
ncbi:MAG: flagellar filament capping protein FliD, partial [Planctomycetes bacterium]|nr:flagellar filament capping protein FliD [Planctomycetota bacterium]